MLQDITYLSLKFADIKDPVNYYKTGGTMNEMNSLRTLYNNIKLTWGLGNNDLKLAVSETGEVYRFTMTSRKVIFGFLIYIPKFKRIDIYTSENYTSENVNLPMVQYVGRKIVYKTYPLLFTKMGFEKLFEKLILVL